MNGSDVNTTPPRRGFGRRLRRYFVTGLVVIAPVSLTAYVLWWIFDRMDDLFGEPLERLLGMRIPGLGFVLLVALVIAIGWLARRAVGRQLLMWWNESFSRFPLTGRLYNAVSQVVQSVVGSKQRLFRRTVLIPFPTNDTWAIAFVTNDETTFFSQAIGEPCVNVFMPTTPNPTTGFLLIVPAAKVKNLDVSVEDGMKLILSAGSLNPGTPAIVGRRGLDLESLLKDTLG